MEIHLFDHDQYSENFTINVNIKDSWYIDRFYVVVWKSHAEIFNNEQKFKKLLKYLMKDNNYKQNYRNLQGIKRKRPLDHEERVKSYQQKEKDKNIIISYDLETSIEGSM